jgi:nucleolin
MLALGLSLTWYSSYSHRSTASASPSSASLSKKAATANQLCVMSMSMASMRVPLSVRHNSTKATQPHSQPQQKLHYTSKNAIFVARLPLSATAETLRAAYGFEACGEIVSTEILLRADGGSRGCGYVLFKDGEEAVRRAVEMMEMKESGANENKLFVEPASPRSRSGTNTGAGAPGNVLYVGGLPSVARETDVRQMFAVFGELESVRLGKDRETGKMLGFAHVHFGVSGHTSSPGQSAKGSKGAKGSNEKGQIAAEQAIKKMNGRVMGTKKLRVNYATPRPDWERVYAVGQGPAAGVGAGGRGSGSSSRGRGEREFRRGGGGGGGRGGGR